MFDWAFTGLKKDKKSVDYGLKLLPILLCLIPVIAINLGFDFLAQIDLRWREQEQQEIARQELESLSSGAEFSYQLSRHAGQFSELLESSAQADINPKALTGFLGGRLKNIFKKPFPEYELFAFRPSLSGKRSEMFLCHSRQIVGKRAFSKAFDYLVSLSKKRESSAIEQRQSNRIISRLFGPNSKPDILAFSQRAKSTNVIYNRRPHWLIWDYKEIPEKGVWGYFIVTKMAPENRIAAKLIALKSIKKRKAGIAGFVPLVPGFEGNVLFPELSHSRLFKKWLRASVPSLGKGLEKWQDEGVPPVKELGVYNVFSHLGKNQSHLTVFLLPKEKKENLPIWIWFFNLFSIPTLLLLAVRGLLFNIWIEFKLKTRFLVIYLLVATMPLSLLAISALGYLNEFSFSRMNQTSSRLMGCLRQFDARKTQVLDDYKSTVSEVFNDSVLPKIVKKYGVNSPEARKRILKFFKERKNPLPLMGFYLLDLSGEGLCYYEDALPEQLDLAFKVFRAPIVERLRANYRARFPDDKIPDFKKTEEEKFGSLAYNSVASYELSEEIEKRRGTPIARKLGVYTATQMHNFLKIDGKESAVLYVLWDDRKLDSRTIKSSIDYFGLNYPTFSFVAFRNTPIGFEPLVPPSRHHDSRFLVSASKIAELSVARGGSISKTINGYTIVALPSRNYSDTILVGGISEYYLQVEIRNRYLVLVSIVILSLIILYLSSLFTAKLVLTPITELKKGLDRVSGGDLEFEVKSERLDELGEVCGEFSGMVGGMRERGRLASLLSDQAIEALATAGTSSNSMLEGKSFSGVALVSDIRNFTTLCESYSPQEITELLNEHFAQMASVIMRHGGRIYKFIGDAIEAIFPDEDFNDLNASERALKASVEMFFVLRKINSERESRGLFPYAIGMGFEKGVFFSGGVGSLETRMDYVVLGKPMESATNLEALTKLNPLLPIVLGPTAKNDINWLDFNFFKVANGSEIGFSLSEGSAGIDSIKKDWENISFGFKKKSSQSENINTGSFKVVNLSSEKERKSSNLTFFCVLVFLFLLGFGIFNGFKERSELVNDFNKVVGVQKNFRLIEQLKSEDSAKVAFELGISRFINRINSKLIWNENDKNAQTIKSYAALEARRLELSGIKLPRLLVFTYNYDQIKTGNIELAANTVHTHGVSEESKLILKALSVYQFCKFMGYPSREYKLIFANKLSQVFGRDISVGILSTETFGAALQVLNNDVPEYFFWDYIKLFDPKLEKISFANGANKLSGCPTGKYHIAGMVMASVNVKNIKNSPDFIVWGYGEEEVDFAIIAQNGKVSNTHGFPVEKFEKLTYSSPLARDNNYLFNEDVLILGGEKYRLIVAYQLPNSLGMNLRSLGVIVTSLLIILSLYCYFSFYGNTFFSRSLSAKLWISILLVSLIPVVTVCFVLDLFISEQGRTLVFQEKLELRSFLDAFELRQFYFQPIARNLLKKWSTDKLLLEIAESGEKNFGSPKFSENKEQFKKYFLDKYRNGVKAFRWRTNFFPREAVLVSKTGWSFSCNGNNPKKESEFGILLAQVAKRLYSIIEKDSGKKTFSASDVKSEMIMDMGFETVRSSFGEDEYIRLANSIGEVVELEVTTGAAGVYIQPIPSIDNPKFMIIWMNIFESGGHLSKLARSSKGKYAVFSIESHRYGRLAEPDVARGELGLEKTASWIAASNLPVSLERNYGDEKILIEGRPGIAQFTSLLIGMAAQAPILQNIRELTNKFQRILILTLFLLFLVGHKAVSDILNPIKSLIQGMQQISRQNFHYRINTDRKDELGDLCRAFDNMARGLEEKELMGKMVSQTARNSSGEDKFCGSEQSQLKKELGFIFIGIPGFSSWLTMGDPADLFNDLAIQTSVLCKIILDAGGDVDKIMGDKLLGVFEPGKSLNESMLSMIKIVEMILKAEESGNLPFPVAIGVNYGEVISGYLGVGEKRDFTVIGDAVNVSARIEKEAEKFRFQRCLFSENVVSNLEDRTRFRLHGEVILKGKSSGLKLFHKI